MEHSTYNPSTSPLEERETSHASIVNIAAIGDLHCPYTNPGYLKSVFKGIGAQADVALLCGDLIYYGEPSEIMILLECLQTLQCPVIGVLGNHDFKGRKADTVTQLLQEAGVTILDGHAHTLRGIDFIGTKGFAGGFGKYALQAWGEPPLKDFVKETKNEAEKLDAALQQGKIPIASCSFITLPFDRRLKGKRKKLFPFSVPVHSKTFSCVTL